MKALAITRKTLLELLREPLLPGLMLGFPIMLVCIFFLAFGRADEGMAEYLKVMVHNADTGITRPDGTRWSGGEELVARVRGTSFEGQPVFTLEEVSDRALAETSLRERKSALFLLIPPDFSTNLTNSRAHRAEAPSRVELVGDAASNPNYILAASFLYDIVRGYGLDAAGRADELTVQWEFLPGTGTLSDFVLGVPGVIIFGVLFVVISAATTLVRENVGRTLRRLRMTHATARDLLVGVTLAQMIVAAVQVPLTFGVAWAFGFRTPGSLVLAIGVALLLTLAAVGFGLLVACFARSDGDAANLGAGVLVPMAFLSGAMMPMPPAPIAEVMGHTIEVYDLLPPTHALDAMQRVLVYGESISDVAVPLAALAVLSVASLALGVLLYGRLRMRAE